MSPALAGRFFTTSTTGKPHIYLFPILFKINQSILALQSCVSTIQQSEAAIHICILPLFCITHIFRFYKNGIHDLICKAEIDKDVQNKHMDTKGEMGAGINWEIEIDVYILLILHIKQRTNENLLYSTGNSTQ